MSNLALKTEFKGYLQVVRMLRGNIVESKNLKSKEIQFLNNYRGLQDVYCTMNTSYNGKRGIEYLKELRALYIDIDLRNEEITKEKINFIIAQVYWLSELEEIPRPSKVNFTGRGVHIIWNLEISSYGALGTWQELEDYLYYKLKDLGADKGATDGARILRLENTYNSKTNTLCETIIEEENIYSMYDLREKYLSWSNRNKKVSNAATNKTKKNIVNLFNSYSLHKERANDLLKIVRGRKGDIKGNRNFILHCYAYWKGIYARDKEDLKELVYDLNKSFKEPMNDSEVDKILRCIPKAIDRFLDYEQGIRTGKIKRVTKGMKDKGGYWYKNETIIERLNITDIEQREYNLKTIIGLKEKYRRNNEKRTPRNKNGLTDKQQELQDLKIKVLELKATGLSNRAVAKELKVSEYKVRSLLKK